ncbi:Cof-type HAD-IIB family hydrolase [Oceanobacillus kimchii]|uniref:Cof-type HAD-IIB family hydrolase n=1 Tax=Oceanobacillus kimchii TaxID=746691 RepID=UPI00034553DB|nr:Cof-type HAD-IIB family hydrolase [Oceanobacillus kimchii]
MKLIASDLDGTLLKEDGTISEANQKAIQTAIDKGIEFIVATGRSYDAASIPLKKAGINCPVISLNGAVTYTKDKQIIRSIPLDKDVAKQITDVCDQEGMYIELFTNRGIFSGSREYFLEVMVDIMTSANPDISEADVRQQAERRFQFEPVEFIDNYHEVMDSTEIKVYKILVFATEPQQLSNASEKLRSEEGVVITSSGEINLEFNHPKAQKGLAVEQYVQQKQWTMEDVMSIGDNWNDASMLQMAGRGVAMGNAADEIKMLCSYTTLTNRDDGVAIAIDEMLKEQQRAIDASL